MRRYQKKTTDVKDRGRGCTGERTVLGLVMRFVLMCFVLVGGFALASPFSSGPAAAAGYEDVQSYGPFSTPLRFPYFARERTKMKLHSKRHDILMKTMPLCNRDDIECKSYELGRPEVELECSAEGTWEVTRSSGSCISSLTFCTVSAEDGAEEGEEPFCRTVRGKNAVQTLEVDYKNDGLDYANCRGDENLAGPGDKELCIFNYDGEDSGIKYNDIDGMFELYPGAAAYFVFDEFSETAKYVTRAADDVDQEPLPIPATPAGNFAAYRKFLEDYKYSSHDDDDKDYDQPVRIENACPPVDIRICNTLMPQALLPMIPPVNGKCGPAHGDESYTAVADIPHDDLCAFGDPLVLSSFGKRIEWECQPPAMMKGAGEADCYAGTPVDGVCGPVAGADGKYAEMAQIDEADYCEHAESVREKHETKHEITWECRGLNGGQDTECWVGK